MPSLIKKAYIQNVRVSERTSWRHIILEAGPHVGVGEFTVESPNPNLDAEAAEVARTVVGSTVSAELTETLGDLRKRDLAGAAIVSAIDQAIHDLLAQFSDVPLAELYGHSGDWPKIALYANINRRTTERSPEGFRASALIARDEGFDAVKLAPFDHITPDIANTTEGRELLRRAMERIEAVSDGVAADTSIFVDCHWRLRSEIVREILPDLSAMGIVWLECPLPENTTTATEIAALRHKANEVGIRLAGCECMTLWEGFRPFVEAAAYDVIMPDVKYVGGFAALKKVVERSWQLGTRVSLHNPSGPICHLHSLHASIALGLTEPLEIQFDESPLFETITDFSPVFRDGRARLPGGVGIGAALTEEA